MATGAEEAGLLAKWGGWVLTGLMSFVVGVITFLGKRVIDKHDQEIKEIKEGISKVGSEMKSATASINEKISDIEKGYVPEARYEQNRQETREGLIAIFNRLDGFGQALARIEGKLEK